MNPKTTDRKTTPLRFDLDRIRGDFPILSREVHGRRLAYLDNAASTQKPRAVVEALENFYFSEYSNVHRGVHYLSQRATEAFENARARVGRFVNAERAEEIVFTRGATEAINLVARSFAAPHLGPDDEILITTMEHHSNIVPWQLACEAAGARLRVAPISDDGDLEIDRLESMIGDKTRLVSVVHVSNSLGTVNPIAEIARRAHSRGVPVLVDGAQAAPHLPIDVQSLGCDFYAFSGHKVYGPTGIGVLWGRHELLEQMPPWQGGGDMIESVSFEKTTYREPPFRFEAGTPNISGAVGLSAALDYIDELNIESVRAHEAELIDDTLLRLEQTEGVHLIGRPARRCGVISFNMEGIHPHDIGSIVDLEGVAIRTGHHCTQPLMDRLGVTATARASFGIYNGRDDVDALLNALDKVRSIFGKGG